MKKKLDFSTQHYFQFQFVILGLALMPLSLVSGYPLLSIALVILALIFTTTHYRLRIDTQLETYREYLWILGIKKGAEEPFPGVEYLYINRVECESEYGMVARLSVRRTMYMGYVKLSNEESVFIGERKKEEKLMKKAERISDFFNIEIRKNY